MNVSVFSISYGQKWKTRKEKVAKKVFLRHYNAIFVSVMEKLYTLRDVTPGGKHDSVKMRRGRNERRKCPELLTRCNQAWENLRNVREVRERTNNYTFGDQWGDLIHYHGGMITEREYIKRKGNIPLSNNIMISIFNSLTGLYAKQGSEPVCFARTRDAQWLSDMMSATLQANWQDTNQAEILLALFKEYLTGGVLMARESFECRDGQWDTWCDPCNTNLVFWEGGGTDPRHKDMSLIGVLHEISRADLYNKFARKEYGLTVAELNKIFDINDDEYFTGLQQNDSHDLRNLSFYTPSNKRYCRVIECWTLETKARYQCVDPIAKSADEARYRVEIVDIGRVREENVKRKKIYDEAGVPVEERAYITAEEIIDKFWYYTFMSPDGTVLCEGETPYEFESHPFTLKLYPFVNGEIHPFLGTIIDQQRYINRLVVMHDMAAKSAAKGITIVPKSCIPDDMTPQDFADEFTEYDGIIFYETSRLNPTARPEIITSNAVQIGTYELLQLEINLTKEITNVSGALQGKTPSSGTSAQRYSMETQNSTTSLFSLLSDMESASEQIAKKKVSNIKQFYDDGRQIINKDRTGMIEYDRMSARDVSFKISIKESGATAAYQTQINDTAMQLLQMGAIDVVQYLKCVNLPFADTLLNVILDQRQQDMIQQQLTAQAQGMSAEQQQAANVNVGKAQQMLAGN